MNGVVLGLSPWIPDGTYTVSFTHYETCKSWGQCKVEAHFSVRDGEYAGTPLTRFYNVKALIGGPGENARFEVTARQSLAREFCALLPSLASLSAVDLNAYKDKLIRAEVATVGKDGLGQELAETNRYSRIKRLIEIVPEDYSAMFEKKRD